jgi:hypothetical protein
MTRIRDIAVKKASIKSAQEILKFQKLAYVGEAEIIDDFTIPLLHQQLRKSYLNLIAVFS